MNECVKWSKPLKHVFDFIPFLNGLDFLFWHLDSNFFAGHYLLLFELFSLYFLHNLVEHFLNIIKKVTSSASLSSSFSTNIFICSCICSCSRFLKFASWIKSINLSEFFWCSSSCFLVSSKILAVSAVISAAYSWPTFYKTAFLWTITCLTCNGIAYLYLLVHSRCFG